MTNRGFGKVHYLPGGEPLAEAANRDFCASGFVILLSFVIRISEFGSNPTNLRLAQFHPSP